MAVIGHGIDLADVERIEEMLDRHGGRFMDRCFTVREQAYCEAGGPRRGERYAARFAAKEAVLKALGTGLAGGIAWTQIEVVRSDEGKPGVELREEALQIAEAAGVRSWMLSLTHIENLSMASAIALTDAPAC
jgi:holo-[acyl-carrier protein] synthase